MNLKSSFAILVSIFLFIPTYGQSPKSCLGNWKNNNKGQLNYLAIKKKGGGYWVEAFEIQEVGQSKKTVFSTNASSKGNKLYVESKYKGRPFKGEISVSSSKLILKMLVKDAKKGMLRTKTIFSKDAPNPNALTSKPGYIQLWDCQECIDGEKGVRGNAHLPVQIYLRSKKMKKTQYGFEEPAIEMYLNFTDQKGNYARFAVPALEKGEYEVFVQYKSRVDSFLEPDPLPYEGTILKARGDLPIRLNIPRSKQ